VFATLSLILVGFYFIFSEKKGAFCLVAIGLPSVFGLSLWAKKGIGLPLFPMLIIQHLIIYSLPLFSQDDLTTVGLYSEAFLTKAGIEIAIFILAFSFTWLFGMKVFHPSPPMAYVLVDFVNEGAKQFNRLGFWLIYASTSYYFLSPLGLDSVVNNLLPVGTQSIVTALLSAISSCGFFLISLSIGSGKSTGTQKTIFWTLLVINSLLASCSLLLSCASACLFATMIGLIWSSGKLPLRFILVIIALLSFFNLGKYDMRTKYWGEEGEMGKTVFLSQIPGFYVDWCNASFRGMTNYGGSSPNSKDNSSTTNSISLSQRINNLQNILFAIDAVESKNIPVLDGKTYLVIPPLLIPRLFWPDKPRTHEGQIMLNVHFGRQDLDSTYKAYIAWGLLPEAYGNFGALYGSLFLGIIMGICCAWAENFTARKPIMSVEGFCSFIIFLGMANSFEMVASVLITSIFQSLIPILVATIPFSRKMVIRRKVEQDS
jgi:hypothetical protein